MANLVNEIRYKDFGQLSLADIMVYESIPPHPFWSAVDKVVDFSFADQLFAPLYSPYGQRPYAPSLKLKIHLIQRYYDISDREMELKVIGDIFVKRFIGLPITHAKFDHSTIGLDRNRLGAEMFLACHNHVLAQALKAGLWGDEDDLWLMDSFHTYARVAKRSTYDLIRTAALGVIRMLKRQNSSMYEELKQDHSVRDMLKRFDGNTQAAEQNLQFSSLVVHLYGLLVWIEAEEKKGRLSWGDEKTRGKFQERKELLQRVLRENVQPAPDDTDSDSSSPPSSEETSVSATNESASPKPSSEKIQYQEIPKDKKPADRIISTYTPDVRAGHKSKKVSFVGDKIQVVESAKSGLVLLAEPIAANEGDGEALIPLIRSIIDVHHVIPGKIVADSAYGSGENRYQAQQQLHTPLVAPVPKQSNNMGLYPKEQFQYQKQENRVICPGEKASYRSQHNAALKGTQYYFRQEDCDACPLRTKCTSSTSGRSIFLTDHWELVEDGLQYNQTDEGKAELKERRDVERENNEMKNHHGLVRPRTHGRPALRIDSIVTAMVVNLKVMVKHLWPKYAQNRLAVQ